MEVTHLSELPCTQKTESLTRVLSQDSVFKHVLGPALDTGDVKVHEANAVIVGMTRPKQYTEIGTVSCN